MRSEFYIHPALSELAIRPRLLTIITSNVYSSRHVQIVSAKSNSETNLIFVSRKLYASNIACGECLVFEGQHYHKKYYGDLFVAKVVGIAKPTIELFSTFASYHFHLLGKHALETLIDGDRGSFLEAVEAEDLEYLSRNKRISRFIASRLLIFCHENLEK